jgi:uncharacterized protein (TIGR02466 family)
MNVHTLFPTLIGYCENVLNEVDNNNLLEKCYALEKAVPPNYNNGWLSAENSPYATMFSHNMSKDENFKDFVSKVNHHVHEYARLCGDNLQYVCSNAWMNIYRNNNYQEPHIHQHNMYSAVYFASAPEGSGNIVFVNPISYILTNGNSAEALSYSYKPKNGLLLVFKSSLIHYVLHSQTSKDRISIAFNYAYSPEQYKMQMGF